jgi:hypothetical protein
MADRQGWLRTPTGWGWFHEGETPTEVGNHAVLGETPTVVGCVGELLAMPVRLRKEKPPPEWGGDCNLV